MSEKPVAWILETRGYSGPEMPDEYDTHITMLDPKDERYTPLYVQSPSVARALAIAECARVIDAKIASYAKDHAVPDAYECMEAVRALSPAPSVSEEWVRYVATSGNLFDKKNSGVAFEAVRATLAALGVEVK